MTKFIIQFKYFSSPSHKQNLFEIYYSPTMYSNHPQSTARGPHSEKHTQSPSHTETSTHRNTQTLTHTHATETHTLFNSH